MRIPSGYLYYDTPIGILCLDTLFPKPPGQLRNPLTFDFPVVCRVLRGVGAKEILSSTSAQLETLFVDAARELERDGVKAHRRKLRLHGPVSEGRGQRRFRPGAHVQPCPDPAHPYLARPGLPHRRAHRAFRLADARAFPAGGRSRRQIDALAIAGMENFPVFRKTILEGAAPSWTRTPWARRSGQPRPP